MAIKMDGHTITELKLKASDGSEVTKQLTEEGTIPTPTGSLSINANGTYDVTDKASAVVNVPAPEINLQNKTATANGEVTADEGYDGLGVVTVAVSGDTPTYQEKTATQNGVVLPDEGYDALSKVTVNVPAPVLPTLTNPASASDILSGKEAIDGNGAKLVGTCTFDADTSDADAVASDIAQGKTAYVNGVKLTGTASGGGAALNHTTFTLEEDLTTDIDASQYGVPSTANYVMCVMRDIATAGITTNHTVGTVFLGGLGNWHFAFTTSSSAAPPSGGSLVYANNTKSASALVVFSSARPFAAGTYDLYWI